MTGTVGILNVGAGDTKLSFDPSNPAERIRAARIVRDMIRRGYALLVEVRRDDKDQPVYQRAHDFDEDKAEYIIADFDGAAAADADADEASSGGAEPPPRKLRQVKSKRIDAGKTSAVAVARTSGG